MVNDGLYKVNVEQIMEGQFYRKEDVDKLLQAIKDGTVTPESIDSTMRTMHVPGTVNVNPLYVPTCMAFGCHSTAGTGIIVIVPDERRNGTY